MRLLGPQWERGHLGRSRRQYRTTSTGSCEPQRPTGQNPFTITGLASRLCHGSWQCPKHDRCEPRSCGQQFEQRMGNCRDRWCPDGHPLFQGYRRTITDGSDGRRPGREINPKPRGDETDQTGCAPRRRGPAWGGRPGHSTMPDRPRTLSAPARPPDAVRLTRPGLAAPIRWPSSALLRPYRERR